MQETLIILYKNTYHASLLPLSIYKYFYSNCIEEIYF